MKRLSATAAALLALAVARTALAAGPSVLVFVRPDQPQSDKVIAQLAASLKDRPDLQVTAIISGEEADALVKNLAGKWPFKTAVDTKYDISGKHGVKVWPTTVLLKPDGTQAGHIGGLPASYARDLSAYLQFAEGKITNDELQKQLANTATVGDSTEQKALRHIEVAQRLAEKGSKDAAIAELAKAAVFNPTESATQIALARANLTLGRAAEAEKILAALPAASAEVRTLNGWTAVQLNRWTEAKKVLTEAVKLNPQPAEAYYLLGLVALNEKDSAAAATCFKKAFEHTATGKAMGQAD